MKEDYEGQLVAAEGDRSRALQELTELYEARLQEKTQLLAQVSPSPPSPLKEWRWQSISGHTGVEFLCPVQCQEAAEHQSLEFNETMKKVQEHEERKILDMQIKYEKKLHTESETNANLHGVNNIMTQKVTNPSHLLCFNLNINPCSSATAVISVVQFEETDR